MFTVECPGCRASYQVDERRVPAGGLRMRCPKCSTAFVVEKPTGTAENPDPGDLPAHVESPTQASKTLAAKAPPPRPVRPAPPTEAAALPDLRQTQKEPATKGPTADKPRPKLGSPTVATRPGGLSPRPTTAESAPLAPRPGTAQPPLPVQAEASDLPASTSQATTRQGPALGPRTAPGPGTGLGLGLAPGGRLAEGGAKPPTAGTPPVRPLQKTPVASALGAELPAIVAPENRRDLPASAPTRPQARSPIATRTASGPSAEEPSLLPAVRHAPTEKDLRAVSAESLGHAAAATSLASGAHGATTEPDLPVAADVSSYDRDSDLPAAFGQKPGGATAGLAQPRPSAITVEHGSFGSESSARDDAFDNLDFGLLPDVHSKGTAALQRPADAGAAMPSVDRVELELELPSPRGPATAAHRPKAHSLPPMVDDFEFDLPSPAQANLPTAATSQGLRAGSSPALAELPDLDVGNLPVVSRGTSRDGTDLPDLDIGLPQVGVTAVGLPQLAGAIDRSSKTLSGTGSVAPGAPHLQESAIPELDLGWGASGSVPPGGSPSEPAFGSLPPAFGVSSPSAPSLPPALGGALSSRNALDSLPPLGSPNLGSQSVRDVAPHSSAGYRPAQGSGAQLDRDMELSLEGNAAPPRPRLASVPPAASMNPIIRDAASGGVGYGEVSLDANDDALSVDTEGGVGRPSLNSTEVLEFGGLPQSEGHAEPALAGHAKAAEGAAAATAAVTLRQGAPASPATVGTRRLKARHVVLGLLAAAVTAGAALSLAPDIGFFGSYFIIDQVKAKENTALVQSQIQAGAMVLARDDFSGVVATAKGLERLRREHGRLHALSAYFAYFSYSVELRYGAQPKFHGAAEVAINELKQKNALPYLGLAHAVRAAVDGNLARARRDVDAILLQQPRSVDAIILSAEIALLERHAAEALQPWKMANNLQPTARTAFGLARTHAALGQNEDASRFAKEALKLNSNHVGAALLLARLALVGKAQAAEAEQLIQSVLSRVGVLSTSDFVQAKTLSGDVHLLHSRISQAEASYQEALEKDPKASSALRGLGETLYRAGRYAESLARFEAGLQADPDDIDAAVGAAKAQLSLERIRDALSLLTKLRQGHPKAYSVNYWYGRANEAGGNRDEAEKAYAAAIEAGGDNPIVVDAYVGLALVKNQQGRREEAQNVLVLAQSKLPKLPKIYEALGQLALTEGRYAAAVEQFEQAQKLDPTDVGIRFRLGSAHRKNRDFDAAAKCFDEVAAVDRDYPGLALERGQLYESSGRTEEALRAFESALAKAPTDPDLMLRVGCGKVVAGRPEQAEELLKKVLEQRPTSAETHHCLGRAQLLEGSNLALALRTLERAAELDPHRAEFHLYVGWVANEVGKIAEAESALKKALELDQGLGDAYWQRGILRYRQGAIKDAVADLTRALELRPGRYEAHAALADAYFDLGLEVKALEQWAKATAAQPDNATWAYRYGKLLEAGHRDAEGKTYLEKAIELAEKLTVKPRWIWDAHYLMARALGQKPAAVKHWKAFLELAPSDNVYREEATSALQKLGQTVGPN